jgi:hypothetical protein
VHDVDVIVKPKLPKIQRGAGRGGYRNMGMGMGSDMGGRGYGRARGEPRWLGAGAWQQLRVPCMAAAALAA